MTPTERSTLQYLRLIASTKRPTVDEIARVSGHHRKVVLSWLGHHPELATRAPPQPLKRRPREVTLTEFGDALLSTYLAHRSCWDPDRALEGAL